jgi:hypothetical protein
MQVYVKRSDLLRIYTTFCNAYPSTFNNTYLSVSPDEFLLLAKLISIFLTKEVIFNMDYDDQADISCIYQTETLDKHVLQNLLDTMEQQALLHHGAVVKLKLTNASVILTMLERILVDKNSNCKMQSHQDSITLGKLFSIQNKLGFSNFDYPIGNNIHFSLKTGDTAIVADNSGAKTVQILSEIEPMVYIVRILTTKFGNERKFPHGKKYAVVLLHDLLSDAELSNKVCLFDYLGGITQPLFTLVFDNGLWLSKDVLNYQKIINSCLFL